MPAQVIDGKLVAARVRDAAAREASALAAAGRPPLLVAVQVGESAASEVYLASQRESCAGAGIGYRLDRLPADATQAALEAHLRALGADPAVTGIILQLPLPAGLDAAAAHAAMDPRKDVEGVHPANLGGAAAGGSIRPCTALAALACVEATGVALRGVEAVVVGHSAIVGKPTALLLLDALATVTVCHVGTRDLAFHTKRAEVLVVAVGRPDLVRADMVRPGAVVVDVGINRVKGPTGRARTVGDCAADVRDVAGWLTPVPGGVGPVTVAMLLRNTVAAAAAARTAGR